MDLARIARHLLFAPWRLRRAFPALVLAAVEDTIQASEEMHGGEIGFAVEGALDIGPLLKGQSARERAIEVFSLLRMWDTEHNNGVLLYLLLADRDVEIVADRGIHSRVGAQEWESICRAMEAAFGQGDYPNGVRAGIEAITRLLAKHYPPAAGARNELPNRVIIL